MNREFKFRIWDKLRNQYLSGDQILISIKKGKRPNANNIYLDIFKYANQYNDRFIIEQYTGLKDKNGVEIYEGDICIISGMDWMGEKAIKFEHATFKFGIQPLGTLDFTNLMIVGNTNIKE